MSDISSNGTGTELIKQGRGGKRKRTSKEQVDKIRELAPNHCSAEIAAIAGIRQATVTYLCSKLGIALGKINPNESRIRVGKDVVKIYVKEAAKRGMTPDSLIYKLLVRIAKDNIIDAVLDDVKEPRECPKKPSKSS